MNNDVFGYEFIEFSGGINIFSDLKATYAQVAREEVIERNPDIIILAATTSSGSEEAEYWSRFKDMAAVKNNAVFVVDPYKVSQPTPLKFLEGLKEIVSLVHPEVIHKGTSSR
jgi:iron complex transport system substrate-binding protein